MIITKKVQQEWGENGGERSCNALYCFVIGSVLGRCTWVVAWARRLAPLNQLSFRCVVANKQGWLVPYLPNFVKTDVNRFCSYSSTILSTQVSQLSKPSSAWQYGRTKGLLQILPARFRSSEARKTTAQAQGRESLH